MINYQQAEKINAILDQLVKFKGNDQIRIKDIGLKLNIPKSEIVFLISELRFIKFDENPVLTIIHGEYLTDMGLIDELDYIKINVIRNHNTKKFLDAGGAVAWYNQKQQELKQEEKRKELEFQNLEEALKKSRFSKKLSIISIVIAGLTFLIEIIRIIFFT